MRSLFFCRFLVLALLFNGLWATAGAAQTMRWYTDRVILAQNTANATAALGSDPATQATLTPPALLSTALLRLGFAGQVPVGSKAGLKINTGGILALGALAGMEINTYLAPGTRPQQSISVGQLLSLELLNKGEQPAEFTVTKPFDRIELAAGGMLNVYSVGLAYAYADVAAPLPVTLVAFSGRPTAGGVALGWQTASEVNNSYFAVERAPEGQADSFTELGRVAGGGTTRAGQRYEFLDAAPGSGGYYRLRQVDADGQAHYSPVVVVRAGAGPTLSAYPSPATATLLVASATETRLALLTARGELVRHYPVRAGQQVLDVSALPAGIYYLRDPATGRSIRFVKAG